MNDELDDDYPGDVFVWNRGYATTPDLLTHGWWVQREAAEDYADYALDSVMRSVCSGTVPDVALADFRSTLSACDLSSWTLSNTTACEGKRVGISCDTNGVVVGLDLSGGKCFGFLDEHALIPLSQLPLQTLNLSSNRLEGLLDVSLLPQTLRNLSLSANPPLMGSLDLTALPPQLEVLDLSQ
eukprot:RCo044674